MYQLREITIRNGSHIRNILVIDFNDPKMAIVGEFLMNDASLLDYSVLSEIDNVLFGLSDYEESSGNRCALEIKRDKTLVEDLFVDMFDDFDTFPAYEIDTKELRDLIVMWKQEMKDFNHKQGYE